MSQTDELLSWAIRGQSLSAGEAFELYTRAGDGELMEAAHAIRMQKHPNRDVGWIIDRNVNITNICLSFCTFCNFCRREGDPDAYITTMGEYRVKIRELFELGGRQLLLQGGMHPRLGLDYYISLFRDLKAEFPELRLHALGPPEIVHLARLEKAEYGTILTSLTEAGMDSLPGAGAEILSNRVREEVSRAKCTADEWLEVMRIAHTMKIPTSATMMFGHIENEMERIEHLILLRELQSQKPEGSRGFINFVPWPFMDEGTVLKTRRGVSGSVTARQYIRTIAISRIVLNNIEHIQASWLTVGVPAAQVCLHAGANDFGSVMIEENVVSSAGASHKMDAVGMQEAIRGSGFTPRLRNQLFDWLD